MDSVTLESTRVVPLRFIQSLRRDTARHRPSSLVPLNVLRECWTTRLKRHPLDEEALKYGVERERLHVPLGDGQVCEGEMEGLLCATTKALRDECHCQGRRRRGRVQGD